MAAGTIPAAVLPDPAAPGVRTPGIIRASAERTLAVLAALPRGDLLLSYQQKALAEVSRHALLVIEKSRRVGLTWALAADAVLTAAAARGQGGDDVLYISYSQEMTREFVEACALWAKAFMGVSAETGEFLFDDQDPAKPGETRQIKAFRIRFASGFEIVALSSAPRSLRGKQGKVILDEAAFVDDLPALLKAALALLIWGSKVIVVSTHDGVDNAFNQLLDEIRSGGRTGGTLRITFADALDAGLYERVCLVTGRTPSAAGKAAWEAEIRGIYGEAAAEELDCIPSTGCGAFIPAELITACEDPEAGRPELYQGGPVYGGWDVALRRHISVFWPFEDVAGTLILRERCEMEKLTFAQQYEERDRMFRTYRMARVKADQTGMGEKVVEDSVALYGDTFEGVIFTSAVKLRLATTLKDRFERRTIRIPPDPAIRAQLRAIKQAGKSGGAPVFAADENAATHHGDMFWAAALACDAAGDGALAYTGALHASRAAAASEGAARTTSDRMRMRADEESDVERGTW
jgi:phage FluMu gp28-like protein